MADVKCQTANLLFVILFCKNTNKYRECAADGSEWLNARRRHHVRSRQFSRL